MEDERQALVSALTRRDEEDVRRSARAFYEARQPDRRAFDFLVGLLREHGTETPVMHALFDGVFLGAVTLEDDLLFSLRTCVRTREGWMPEQTSREMRLSEACVFHWCYQGFLRNVGINDTRTMDAGEGHCTVLSREHRDEAIALAEELADARERFHGIGSVETLRTRLMHAQLLINVERFEDAFAALVMATSSTEDFDDATDEWLALAERLKGCVQLRLGDYKRGLSTLEAERSRNRTTARFLNNLTMAFWPEDADPLARAIEDLRVAMALNDFNSSTSLSALVRMAVALERAGRAKEAMVARKTYDAWLSATEADPKARAELTQLAQLLSSEGEHAEAARVPTRQVKASK